MLKNNNIERSANEKIEKIFNVKSENFNNRIMRN